MNRARARIADASRHAARALMLVLAMAWLPAAMAATPDANAAGPGASAAPEAAAAKANATVEFDTGMLSGATRHEVDLSRFEKGITVLPGTYNVDLYLNRQWKGRVNVRFVTPDPNTNAHPCMTHDLLSRLGLAADVDATSMTGLDQPGACVQLSKLVDGASTQFDMTHLRLVAHVPQAMLKQQPRRYVSPSSWDAGIPAFLLNYRFNAYRSENNGQGQTSAYLGLDAGINIGLWRLRQQSTATWISGSAGLPSQRHWHTLDAYAKRAIPALKAELTLGDSHTDGSVFDSFALRGVQLSTDDRMRAQSRRGYAPVVRGTAQTNAKVTIRQNGAEIYQTTVPPGPFSINDLYPTGYGGSLQVTVTEADGRQHSFEVPYASVAQLVRPGVTRFNVSAGQLRDLPLGSHPRVVQGVVQHGFDNRFTGYAGFQGSSGYAAALIGAALNTRLGAFALDITQAGVSLPGQKSHTGQSTRLTWSKMVPDTRTYISVAAYRYSTRGFLGLTEAVSARAYARRGLDTFQDQPTQAQTINGVPVRGPLTPAQQAALAGQPVARTYAPRGLLHQRNRFTLSLSQPLGEHGGSLFGNVSVNDYWNRDSRNTTFQLGYNGHVGRVSYGVSAARTRDLSGRFDNRVNLNFSLPLGDSPRAPTFSTNLQHDNRGYTSAQALVTGSAGRDNQFNWNASASHDNAGGGNAGAVSVGYRAPTAVYSASYGKGSGYSQASFGVNGAVVAHAGGVTFGQPTGETVGLIHAPGAAGAQVQSAPGVRIDSRGYALVPYLAPFQLDSVRIDPQGLPLGVQLDATSARVAPYAGAVARLDFKTHYGRALIARIHRTDNTVLPFGTQVHDGAGQPVGTVGQAGMALLRVKHKRGHLDARWKDAQGSAHSCTFSYTVPAASGRRTAHAVIDAACEAAPSREEKP